MFSLSRATSTSPGGPFLNHFIRQNAQELREGHNRAQATIAQTTLKQLLLAQGGLYIGGLYATDGDHLAAIEWAAAPPMLLSTVYANGYSYQTPRGITLPPPNIVHKAELTRLERLMQPQNSMFVVIDVDSKFLKAGLEGQGYKVFIVPDGMPDLKIRSILELTGARFVTRNFKDFKGFEGVIRVSGTMPLKDQFNTTLNSLEIARINPEVFVRMKQIPASGINLGLVNPPVESER